MIMIFIINIVTKLFTRKILMYIAMNKFKIINGYEQEFEEVWKTRDTFLDKVPGFLKFNLIKGKKGDEFTLYASHSLWNSEISFIEWTNSDSFRKAHKNAGKNKKLYIGHPEFEGFEIII